jgi:hypothetical protein
MRFEPLLRDGEYVFVQMEVPPKDAVATFREDEGLSVIITRARADELSLPYAYVWAWITLGVFSDLAAVGFLAEVTARLARAGISCNAIAALMHDHLFVPYDKRHDALDALSGDAASPS